MCARRHQQMPQFVCDGTSEQRAGVRASLLGHPVDAIDVDGREHTRSGLRVDHRVTEWQHPSRAIGNGVGSNDSDGELSWCERYLAGTRASRVGWRRWLGAGLPEQIDGRDGDDRCGDCQRWAPLRIGGAGVVVDAHSNFREERLRSKRRRL